jgi:D-alanyl-D-alanine carboxypeptidase/D-alanyl-D-alanine-endopeptidase (penicillin-binding protein 4)
MTDRDPGRHQASHGRPAAGRAAATSRRRRIGLALLALCLVAGCLVGVRAAINGEHHNDAARRAAASAATANPTPTKPMPTKPATTKPPTTKPATTSAPSTNPPTASPWWQLAPAAAKSPALPEPDSAVAPTTSGLTTMLTPLLANPALAGDTVGMVVSDVATGSTVFSQHATTGLAPASTAKLATAVAALEVLGPAKQFSTTVVQGATSGQIVIVGGGDPTLAGPAAVGAGDPGYPEPAQLSDLATQAANALKARGQRTVSLGYDASLFTGPATAPGWRPDYLPEGDVAPVSALEVDEGRPDPAKPGRSTDPAPLAALEFAQLLAADGITVTGAPAAVTAGTGATVLATVTSPVLAALVQRMLGRSDNDLAEALARHVAIAVGQPATFAGAAAAVRVSVAKLGVDPAGLAMVDASGLSHSDRMYPAALVQLLNQVVAGHHPELASMLAALPVAGFTGTLEDRYLTSPAAAAAGVVRAKTGTLDGTAALAGYLDDDSGRLLTFALVAGNVPDGATARTEAALDKVATGLAACGCG